MPDGNTMIRSMTGFARRERAAPFGTLAWELRTVNHRYLEVALRLPEEFRPSEGEFRQAIAGLVRRGKVEAALYFRTTSTTAPELELNEPLLERLIEQAQRRLARCFACGTDGAFPATITSRLGRSGSTRASIRICAGCWDRATLPEARATDG